jgi:putative DNA primase/helicase
MLNDPEFAGPSDEEQPKEEAAPARDEADGTGGHPPPNDEGHEAPEVEEAPAQHEVEVGEPPDPPEVEAILATPGAEAPVAEPEALGSVLQPPATKIVHNFDEVGASQRVLAACQDLLRFLTDHKALFVWDGARYGEFAHISRKMALDALDKVHREFEEGRIHITNDGQPVEWEDFLKFQGKVRSLGMINKALALASLAPRIQVTSREFDADQYEINLQNGLFNLDTLKLAPHHPSQLVTKLAPVTWVPDAPCPFWADFIDVITCREKDLAEYIQRLAGYCLTGSTQEEVMPILYGSGANGKSLFLNTLLRILGSNEYGLTLSSEAILNSNTFGIQYYHRQLEGKRLATATETDQGKTLREAVTKTAVAGDEISGRGIGKDPVQFRPRAKIVLGVNHLPALTSTDHATRRRLQVVPFRKQFDGSAQKEALERQVGGEITGIFAWAVRGFQEWRKQGLNPPRVVLEATAAYFEANDHIGTYLKERTAALAGAKTPVKLLFADYTEWAKDCGAKPLGMHQVSELLKAREIDQARTNAARVWLNIVIKRVA